MHDHNGDHPITVRAFLDRAFLDAVLSVSASRSTIEGYATAFRKIVADLFGFASNPAKFDHRSGGRIGWLAKVHRSISARSPQKRFKNGDTHSCRCRENDPVTPRKARISVNSFLRRSRSLFLRKVLRQLQPSLSSPYPLMAWSSNPAKV